MCKKKVPEEPGEIDPEQDVFAENPEVTAERDRVERLMEESDG